MYKSRTRSLHEEVDMKLREVCNWDSESCKFTEREGTPQDVPNHICTSAADAEKVVGFFLLLALILRRSIRQAGLFCAFA